MHAHYPSCYSPYGKRAPSVGLRARLRDALRLPYVLRWGDPAPPLPDVPGRALDLGAGNGTDLAWLASRGWEPWGVEPDAEAATEAGKRLGRGADRVFVGQAEGASFAEESFDLILMMHVIEHLHEPRAVLEAAHRWLRPGGRIVIRCPNFDSLERRIFGRQWRGLDLPRHLFHFSRPTLEAMLQAVGYSPRAFRPELQASSLVGSLRLSAAGLRRRGEPLQARPGMASAVLPLSAALAATGYAPTMEIVADRQQPDQ
jgi:SAM-dependent methyltransferase